jgi:hypothetical protein
MLERGVKVEEQVFCLEGPSQDNREGRESESARRKPIGLAITHLLPRCVLEFYPDVHSAGSLQGRIQGLDMVTDMAMVGLSKASIEDVVHELTL